MNEPLVLLPGMMCDARLFTPQVEGLSGRRTITIASLVGHASVGGLASEVLSQAPPNFALAGLSMGGIVAMEVVRLAPERVTRLALLDTNPLAESENQAALRNEQIDRLQSVGLQAIMRDEMKPHYLTDGPEKPRILKLCMDMAEELGDAVFVDQSRALQTRRDQTDTLMKVDVPALVLCGADDTLCPIRRHELMHQLIPDSKLDIIDGAGHLPTIEQPERTNESLRAWLES